MIEVDGSFGEGGGQILRTSVALSAIIGKPVRISNIRSNRPKPGLAQQHLTGLKAVQKLTDGEAEGLSLGSTEVTFRPRSLKGGSYKIDIGTAGSISLILQVVSLPAAFAKGPVEMEITGGTDVQWSPPADFMRNVFYPILEKIGVKTRFELIRRGYYPKGGGAIRISFEPTTQLNPIEIISRGKLKGVYGVVHSLNLPDHIAKREIESARKVLKGYKTQVKPEIGRGLSTGTGVSLWSEYENTILGASSLGKPGKEAEKVGGEAAEFLIEEIQGSGTLDVQMGDQILAYMGLAKGRSKFIVRELTPHIKTNIHVIEDILGIKFVITEEEKGYAIEVVGVGFRSEA